MTNEQLAALIGAGGNDELLPLLWEKMRKFYRMASDKYARQHADKCAQCGVTADDIRQESYFAMLDSIKAYNDRKPEQEALHFISFCGFPFKNTADRLIGIGHRGTYSDPLKSYTVPLDEPLTDKDGDESTTRGELIPDPDAETPFREIEESAYREYVREAIRGTLLKISPQMWEVIEGAYYRGETLRQIADAQGVSIERARAIKNKALSRLRSNAAIRRLHHIDEYHHIGVEAFKRGGSIVERVTEQQDRARYYLAAVESLDSGGETA